MANSDKNDALNILNDLARDAKKLRVSAFSFDHSASNAVAVGVRNGTIETLEGESPSRVSIEVHLGKRAGYAHSDSLAYADLKMALQEAVAKARISSQDKNKALTDAEDIATEFPDLDLNDPYEPSTEELLARAQAVEGAARANPKIINGDAVAGYQHSTSTMVASNGFSAQEKNSQHYFYTTVIAGTKDAMERDSASTSAVWHTDLDTAEYVGKKAADSTIAKLNSEKMKTGTYPVVFDPEVSGSLVGAFIGAISGNAVFTKSTFLLNQMNKQVFPKGFDIIDDPLVLRGLRSGAFDADGVGRKKLVLVEDGILKTWITGVQSARKLKIKSTGHASGPGNVHMTPGSVSVKDLIADIKDGLYVTGFMGGGANPMTGEYSRGAAGFRIRNGIITAEAISEVTIGGNLSKMFASITRADNLNLEDFKRKSRILTPTLRVEGMTIGGA